MACGQALSLRMTHCLACRMPVSYSVVPHQTSYERQRDAQPSQQHGQNDGLNYTDEVFSPIQAIYTPSSPFQQSLPVGYTLAHTFSPHLAPTYDAIQPQHTKKSRGEHFFLLVIIVCVVLLASISVYKLVQIVNTTGTIKQANTPSGNALVSSASTILKNAQTSSDIDNTLEPLHITRTFTANQKVYVTFTITSGNLDGSIEAKWYTDGQVVASTVLHHTHENTHGVFSNIYITATPDGAVELYWCTQLDCQAAQLAQVIHFVVTPVNTAYLNVYPNGVSIVQRHTLKS